jgi:pimeloyl-ACP methyl ester carboxylesterase
MSEPDAVTRTRRVRVGSLTLRCSVTEPTRAGEGGPPLLLVNGLGANVEMWSPFRRALGARRTVAFDAPGTGGSSTPLRPLSMRALGGITLELLDALDLDAVDVLGYSFGGAIAQEMARAAPHRVRRLVLVATTCGWGALPGDPFALFALLTPARYYFGPVTAAVTAAFGEGTLSDFATADAARVHRPPDPLGYSWQVVAALGWSSLRWLHRVPVPTLVLAPEHDRMVHASTPRLIARRLPNARLEVVRGASHFFLLREHAEPVARRITAFLDAEERSVQPGAEFVCT